MYAQQHPDQYRGGLASAVQAKTTGPNKANVSNDVLITLTIMLVQFFS